MRRFVHSRSFSFRYAFEGLGYALRTQKNTWIHLSATIIVIVLAAWLRVSLFDAAVLAIVIGVVWMSELFNTAIEAVVDLLSPQYHHSAKVAKDVAAAAVLITALTAIVTGLLILAPPLLERMGWPGLP